MRRLRFVVLVLILLQSLFYVQLFDVPAVAASTIYQGDLVLTGNNVTTIEGSFDINGSIIVQDNATLHLENAYLNLTQSSNRQFFISFENPSNGNPRLFAYNSTITSNYLYKFGLWENSTAALNNCTINKATALNVYHDSVLSITNGSTVSMGSAIYARDSSIITINNSMINTFDSQESSEIQLYDSEITYLFTMVNSINCTISNLEPGPVDYWNFINDCSVNIQSGGYAPNLTLNTTTVELYHFSFYGTSNVSIVNSTIRGVNIHDTSSASIKSTKLINGASTTDFATLIMEDSVSQSNLNARESSVMQLLNSTYTYLSILEDDLSEVYLSWYLDVIVEDSVSQVVPSASVTVSYPNTTVFDSKLTDESGLARFPLMEKMVNATGEYPIGNYTVDATYDTYLGSSTVNMTETKQVNLPLENFVIPEFSSLVLLSTFIIATIAVIVVNRRKQQH